MAIHVKNINKSFKNFTALDDVSLEVNSGELISLLGPSGSGKTTLLRTIAGLEFADSGSILLDGQDTSKQGVKDRNVGFVFQHYALFKHMTVFENVAFGLKVRAKEFRPTDAEIKRKVMELLELVHLDSFHDRYPKQLSGGQRQRVALARALAVEPKVLLLDEPFGALDAKVRKELRRWMRKLHDEINITSIFVTHDQEEAMEVSDRVVVMSNGKIEQFGTPAQVWHNPANAFVYDFLGNYNEFDGWKDENGEIHLAESDVLEPINLKDVKTSWFEKHAEFTKFVNKVIPGLIHVENDNTPQFSTKPTAKFGGKPVKIFARPHEMYITKNVDDKEYIRAKVTHINPAGALVKLELERINGKILQVEVAKSVLDYYAINKGDEVFVRPKESRIFV